MPKRKKKSKSGGFKLSPPKRLSNPMRVAIKEESRRSNFSRFESSHK